MKEGEPDHEVYLSDANSRVSRVALIGTIAGDRRSPNEFRDKRAKISGSCCRSSSLEIDGWETYKNGSRSLFELVRTAPSFGALQTKSLSFFPFFFLVFLLFSVYGLYPASNPPCHFPGNITTTCWRDNKFRSFFSRPTLWHPLHIPFAFSTLHPTIAYRRSRRCPSSSICALKFSNYINFLPVTAMYYCNLSHVRNRVPISSTINYSRMRKPVIPDSPCCDSRGHRLHHDQDCLFHLRNLNIIHYTISININ